MKSNAEMLQEKGINLHKKSSGQIKTECPFPGCENRKNKKDTPLSVNIDDGVYNCHHCGEYGRVFEKKLKDYVKPQPRLEKLKPEIIQWFEKSRGISNNTLLRFGVTEANEWMPQFEAESPVICFNYYRGQELVNIKFRGKEKAFKMAKDAELVFYNLNAFEGQKEIIIVEGEIDCLAMYEAGVYNVISVPNGAPPKPKEGRPYSPNLEYLDNCWHHFEGIEKITLATDSDEVGNLLRDELARRIGKERCYRVTYPEGCKDANDVLLKFGKEAVKTVLQKAVLTPIEGILTMDEMYEDIENFFTYGYPEGTKVGIPGFDDLVSFMLGQYTTITGSPSSGKSEFLDYIIASTVKNHKWPWGICSFENQPSSLHATKLMEKLTGKAFGFRPPEKAHCRMNRAEYEYGVGMVDRYVNFINLKQADLTLKGLLEKMKELVQRKGVKGIVIDPWNYIEHRKPESQTETNYINDCLTEIKVFCAINEVALFLVAHPTKLKKENGKYEVATMYHINGSAHFYGKTDVGISVYRDRDTGIVDVHIQKVRFSWLGMEGMCSFMFDKDTRQYKPI